MNADNYDFSWIEQGLIKRRSNYSNVICFETNDPIRLSQLKAYLVSYHTLSNADIFYISRWAGLCRLERATGNFSPIERPAPGAYDGGITNRIEELRDALLYMDKTLKTRKSILILHDLEAAREEEKDRDLINALRDWAFNTEICLSESIIFLVCAHAACILDGATLERVALLRPPIGEQQERARMITDQHQKLMGEPSPHLVNLVAQTTGGLTLNQLKTALLESYNTTGGFDIDKIKELKSDLIKRSDFLEIEDPDPKGFESVGGYESVKKFVHTTIIRTLNEPERAKHFNVKIPRGIIFFGPPRTGKTLFARALAREVHLPFINFRTENLFSQYLGVSGHNFRNAINLIEQMSPAIVFIDEIDRLGKRRGTVNDGASEETRRVLNQILEWLGKKERKSIIVGTTNKPEDLDSAFSVGRIDYWIPFLYPSTEARKSILKIYLQNTQIDEAAIEEMARKTDNYSGAELEETVIRANRLAFTGGAESLSMVHLHKSIENFRINQDMRRHEREEYLKRAELYTNDIDFLRELKLEN